MMLTKTGNEKKASIGVAAATHVMQNIAMKKALGDTRFHKVLLDGFLGKPQGFRFGMAKGLIPELGMAEQAARSAGETARAALGDRKLSARDLVRIRKVLRGDKAGATHGMSSDAKESLHAVLKQHFPNSEAPLEDLTSILHKNQVTGPVMRGIGSQMTAKNLSPATKLPHRLSAPIGEGVATAGMTVADPITGAVNISKRLMSSKSVGEVHPILAKVQHKAEDMLVHKPIQKSFQAGQQEAQKAPSLLSKLKHSASNYGFNYVTTGLQDLGHDIGTLTKKPLQR